MKLNYQQKRKDVIERLENQLKSGVKPQKNKDILNILDKTNGLFGYIPLTEHDIKRINKEIDILKSRI